MKFKFEIEMVGNPCGDMFVYAHTFTENESGIRFFDEDHCHVAGMNKSMVHRIYRAGRVCVFREGEMV